MAKWKLYSEYNSFLFICIALIIKEKEVTNLRLENMAGVVGRGIWEMPKGKGRGKTIEIF